MNQNPENIPPATPEEQRVTPVEEEVKEEVTVARKGLGRIFAVIERSRVGKSTKAGIKKIAAWFTAKAGLKAVVATVSAGVIPAASAAWDTFKKVGKVALEALAAIFMVAAHYGTAALVGATTGLIGGALLGIKLGAMTFGALAPIIGPFAAIPAVIVGVGTLVVTTFIGAVAGIGVQMLLDKIGAALSGVSLPQIGAASFGEASAAAASTAKWFVPAAVGTATVGGIIASQIISSAFVIPTESTAIAPFASPHISISKTVAPDSQFSNNDLPVEITYTLTITAKTQKLINVRIVDKTTVSKEQNPPSVPNRSWHVDEITLSWTINYKLTLDDRFKNSMITNHVTVTADVEGGPSGETASASRTVVVGSPPQDCPSIWPTPHGPVGQGPNTPLSLEKRCTSHYGEEALDITVVVGTTVYATHGGTATSGYSSGGGKYVAISGLCSGRPFTSYYYHLNSIDPNARGEVTAGTPIGKSGATGGDLTGAHLHYEFGGLSMNPPYIPQSVPQGCCEVCLCSPPYYAPCGVNW